MALIGTTSTIMMMMVDQYRQPSQRKMKKQGQKQKRRSMSLSFASCSSSPRRILSSQTQLCIGLLAILLCLLASEYGLVLGRLPWVGTNTNGRGGKSSGSNGSSSNSATSSLLFKGRGGGGTAVASSTTTSSDSSSYQLFFQHRPQHQEQVVVPTLSVATTTLYEFYEDEKNGNGNFFANMFAALPKNKNKKNKKKQQSVKKDKKRQFKLWNPQHQEQQQEPVYSSLPSVTSSSSSSSSRSTTVTTDAAYLVRDFQRVLDAMDESSNNKDVHVGRLLLACARLEESMRNAGFSQSANDIAGNIKKIRSLYDTFPNADQKDSMSALIKYEFDNGVHPDKEHLKEYSAAMGFLWLGRNINYQHELLHDLVNNDDMEPYEAASRAYEKHLKRHLSWTLQKVCSAAMSATLKSMKKRDIFLRIGGFDSSKVDGLGITEEQATKRDLRDVLDSWEPLLARWKQSFNDLGFSSPW